MDSPFMETIAKGLAEEGIRVARFEFPYMAERRRTGKKRPPDSANTLLNTFRAAAAAMNGKLFAVSACTPQQEDAIVAVAADPMNAAIAYGKRFGKCSICARTLTDAESIARGMGAVCATRFGW